MDLPVLDVPFEHEFWISPDGTWAVDLDEQAGWMLLEYIARDWKAHPGGEKLFQELEAWATAEKLLVDQE